MPQAAPVVATEAAVASTMTAAEIAAAQHAAQVAAAQTLAAEQAAALAAQQAAAATTAAATNTATATAANAATNQSVLNAIGAGGGAPASAAQLGVYGGINSLGAGAGAGGGISTLGAGAGTGANLGYETLAKEVSTGGIGELVKSPLIDNTLPGVPPEISNLVSGAQRIADTAPVTEQLAYAGKGSMTSAIPQPPAPTLYGSAPPLGPQPALPSMGPNTYPDIIPQANANAVPTGYEINKPLNNSLGVDQTTGTGIKAPLNQTATYNLTGSGAQPAAKPGMVEEFMNMSLPNKLLTGMMGATGYEMLNKPKPYEKEKYKSTFKPGLYTGYTPVQPTPYRPNYAAGGIADLGGYSDGGRMLKGPGDGMSDDIPATIANKQPAKLANEEFVVPADVVSHLGNGSSEAGAKVLYKMMDRVRQARTGTKKQGKQINPEKYLA